MQKITYYYIAESFSYFIYRTANLNVSAEVDMSIVWKQSVDAFLEELIIRRELADNFCYYQPHYDTLAGAWDWARKTLQDHASDKREHIYT
jgi:hypothetical protein